MMQRVEVEPTGIGEKKEGKPVITQWQGVAMVRAHSMQASVREIANAVSTETSLELVKIGIIGNPSSGKSTVARTIAHLLHKFAKIPFTVRIFTKNELLNFADTLKTLTPTNHILLFDDVSFLGANASKKQIDMIKQANTEIRHLPGGQDVRIVIIMNYHYTLGLDKYLRQSEFKYFTSVGSSELDNMEKIVGNKYMSVVRNFQKTYTRMTNMPEPKIFRYNLGATKFLDYKYKNPFIPLLFFNNDTLRVIVSPKRQWIDNVCTICENAEGITEADLQAAEVCKLGEEKFPESFKTAVKIKLLQHGFNAWSRDARRALMWLDKLMMTKSFSIADLAQYYGFEEKKVFTKKHFDELLSTPEKNETPENTPN